jgi:hypothetical protein
MRQRLGELCPRYAAHPEAWVAERDAELKSRYTLLRLRDGSSYRLDHVCAAGPTGAAAASPIVSAHQP